MGREAGRQTDRQTDGQADGQTNRHTDRQAGGQAGTERQTDTKHNKLVPPGNQSKAKAKKTKQMQENKANACLKDL